MPQPVKHELVTWRKRGPPKGTGLAVFPNLGGRQLRRTRSLLIIPRSEREGYDPKLIDAEPASKKANSAARRASESEY